MLRTRILFACRGPEIDYGKELGSLQAQIRKMEIDLCSSRSLLFKYKAGLKLNLQDQQTLNKQLQAHIEHRQEDQKSAICELDKQIAELVQKRDYIVTLKPDSIPFMNRDELF